VFRNRNYGRPLPWNVPLLPAPGTIPSAGSLPQPVALNAPTEPFSSALNSDTTLPATPNPVPWSSYPSLSLPLPPVSPWSLPSSVALSAVTASTPLPSPSLQSSGQIVAPRDSILYILSPRNLFLLEVSTPLTAPALG
jgi:hypothetical protein